jgi:hypothetical protein
LVQKGGRPEILAAAASDQQIESVG